MAENIIIPRRREDFFNPATEEPQHRFVRWIELVTEQTNSSSIIIESTEQTLTSTGSRVSRNAARINSLELKEFELVNTAIAITTKPFQIIICENVASINITLDPNALRDDEVHIKRRNEEVTVIGLIDGESDLIINVLNFSLHLVYDGTDWNSI